MKKTSIAILVVIVVLVVGGAVWYFTQSPSYSPSAGSSPSSTGLSGNVSGLPQSTSTPGIPNTGTVPISVSVSYDGNGFSPATVTIVQGTSVVFKNNSSKDLRVASDPHPLHNGYPTTGGCVGSTFDSCQTIPPGSSWTFRFDIVGSWGYHNHLNPSQRGTVVVQANNQGKG